MIGVIAKADETATVQEFFELFKTPWESHCAGRRYDVVIATSEEIPEVDAAVLVVYGSDKRKTDARCGITTHLQHRGAFLNYQGIRLPIYGNVLTFDNASAGIPCVTADRGTSGIRNRSADVEILRLGYDLFQEVRFLLSEGQPIENASIPTLDIHIAMLREWILSAGITLLEIPPTPAGHDFVVCLTHDIDFVGIRNHLFDHSMWGFVCRATFGSVRNFLRGRFSFKRLLQCWFAVMSLPLVYAGWTKDFWEPFEWYLKVERNLPATYFLVPFKRRQGEKVHNRYASRRATAYDVGDLAQSTEVLLKQGCELGVHGIDSWNSEEKGRAELARIASVSGVHKVGIRMHWLLCDKNTAGVLDRSGYAYDSTFGYNETVGYRNGTAQAFRPLGVHSLLELPLHIQDGALFYPNKLDLSKREATRRCQVLIDNAKERGGMLTVLWHDRSHAAERFWGDFYMELVRALRGSGAWFGTGIQAADWFQKRRNVRFERLESKVGVRAFAQFDVNKSLPLLRLRVYVPPIVNQVEDTTRQETFAFSDNPWDGRTVEFDSSFRMTFRTPEGLSVHRTRS